MPVKYELLPIIPVTISVARQALTIEALIDSGANRCFCQIEIAQALGVSLSTCKKEIVTGVGGTGEVFIHRVMIDIEHGSFKLAAEVGFGQFSFHGFSCILGQRDFFEKCDVLFQRRKGTVELCIP